MQLYSPCKLRELIKGAIQLLRSHSGGEGVLKMQTKANGERGGGGEFLPIRTFAKKFFFYLLVK